MAKKPKVSVLMPARNAAGTVMQAVSSILRQDFSDFEFVIVDDGSTDDSPSVLSNIAASDSRVRVIRTEAQGIVGALNAGLSECRGELLARMDADDISHPSRLRLQVEMMERCPDLSICACLVRFFPRINLLGGLMRYEEWINSLISHEEIARDVFVESPFPHPGVMLRAKELLELGGYQDVSWPEDYDLWLRYHIAGKRMAKVPKTLIFQRSAPGRLTFTDSRYSLENFLRAKAYYLAEMLLPERKKIILWGAGQTGRRLSKHLLREGLEIEAIVDVDTNKIGHKLRSIPIVSQDYLLNTRAFVVTAVGSARARELIREYLEGIGRQEGLEFVCAA